MTVPGGLLAVAGPAGSPASGSAGRCVDRHVVAGRLAPLSGVASARRSRRRSQVRRAPSSAPDPGHRPGQRRAEAPRPRRADPGGRPTADCRASARPSRPARGSARSVDAVQADPIRRRTRPGPARRRSLSPSTYRTREGDDVRQPVVRIADHLGVRDRARPRGSGRSVSRRRVLLLRVGQHRLSVTAAASAAGTDGVPGTRSVPSPGAAAEIHGCRRRSRAAEPGGAPQARGVGDQQVPPDGAGRGRSTPAAIDQQRHRGGAGRRAARVTGCTVPTSPLALCSRPGQPGERAGRRSVSASTRPADRPPIRHGVAGVARRVQHRGMLHRECSTRSPTRWRAFSVPSTAACDGLGRGSR
jgi:hypothetical protein